MKLTLLDFQRIIRAWEKHMSRLYTIDELVTTIYEDNLSHFEFMENMNGGDCDCALHNTMTTVLQYWE
jgi:hypothetical protein